MSLQPASPPRGTFKGKNIMTPNIVGFYKLRSGWAEIASGEGISRQPIFGVTVAPRSAGESKLFYSLEAAKEYVEDLS